MKIISLLFCVVFFTSCEKEEKIVYVENQPARPAPTVDPSFARQEMVARQEQQRQQQIAQLKRDAEQSKREQSQADRDQQARWDRERQKRDDDARTRALDRRRP